MTEATSEIGAINTEIADRAYSLITEKIPDPDTLAYKKRDALQWTTWFFAGTSDNRKFDSVTIPSSFEEVGETLEEATGELTPFENDEIKS